MRMKIGYSYLNNKEKKFYNDIEKCLLSFSNAINNIDGTVNAMKVLQVVLGDNPHIVYFNKTQIKITSSLFGGKQLQLYGVNSMQKCKEMSNELDLALKKAVEEIELLSPITDYDKLLCIYEYLQDNVEYDEKELEACATLGKSMNPMSHNAYGALVNRKGVCDGIASAFSLIAQSMGYDCMVVNGKATYRTEGFSEHSWNIIKISNKYYHLDVTWDINQKEHTGQYSYDYFCISDKFINKDHIWELTCVPECLYEDMTYYIRNHSYIKEISEIEKIFIRYAKSKSKVVRIRIAETINISEPGDKYLGQLLLNMSASVGRYEGIKCVWNKNTRCFYARFD